MTIAIVAKSSTHPHFVSVSDQMLSYDDAVPAVEGAILKDLSISPEWNVVFTANETHFVLPIIRMATTTLSNIHSEHTLDAVKHAMCNAYSEIMKEYTTREYLTKFGFSSVEQFRDSGVSLLGRKLFWGLSRKIDKFNPELHFIIYGFIDHIGHLFEVKHPGNAFDLDHIGYYAIGSGNAMAMGALHLKPMNTWGLSALIYRLCEAKFAAETAPGVGKNTSVFVKEPGTPQQMIQGHIVDKCRLNWEQWRVQRPPEELLSSIEQSIRNQTAPFRNH